MLQQMKMAWLLHLAPELQVVLAAPVVLESLDQDWGFSTAIYHPFSGHLLVLLLVQQAERESPSAQLPNRHLQRILP